MRRRLLTGLLAGLLALGSAGRSQAQEAAAPAPAAKVQQDRGALDQMREAFRLLKADKAREALAILQPLRDTLEDGGSADLLLSAYDLIGYAGSVLDDRPAAIQGHTQSVLLNHFLSPLSAPDTLTAELTLAETFRSYDVPLGQFYVLANALAALGDARRAGPPSAELEESQAVAEALMGQVLWLDKRPERALSFLRRAQALARAGHVDPVNADKIDGLLQEAEAAAKERTDPRPPTAADCVGEAGLTEARMTACLRAADRAASDGHATAAEQILVNLLTDVPSGSLRADRYAAARDLLLLRMLTRLPRDPDLRATVDLVTNYLASINEVTTAALIGARAARATLDAGTYDAQVARMCGHIARRAVRNGSPDLALRMLAFQRAIVLRGLPDPAVPISKAPANLLDLRLTDVLLRIEAAQIASRSGRARLAAAELEVVDREVAAIDLADFDRIEDRTAVEYAGLTDYVFPSYAAAIELTGRLAARLPVTDPRHDAVTIGWISTTEAWWSDGARADVMAQEAIRNIRAAPQGRSDALVTLLGLRASLVETANPALSSSLTREAYEIVAREPGRESERVELLLDLAGDQTDSGLAQALVAEAQKLREQAADVDLRAKVRLDMKRSFQAFDDGRKDQAAQLAEDAVASLVTAGQKDKWVIVQPARNLAGLYAALGRIDDARRVYETYVFPQSNAAVVGEEKAIADQLGLANLEAYYAPNERTVRVLSTLLERARQRLKADRELARSIQRAQAFAYHGLGDGVKARAAAFEALRVQRPQATDTASAREDRKLLEALVGADWQASGRDAPP